MGTTINGVWWEDFATFTTGATAATGDGWSVVTGAPTYQAASAYGGRARGLQSSVAAANESTVARAQTVADGSEIWVRLWLKVAGVAPGNARIFETRDAGGAPVQQIRATTGQKIDILDRSNVNQGTTVTAYPANAWFSVGVHIKAALQASGGYTEVRLYTDPAAAAGGHDQQITTTAGTWGTTDGTLWAWRVGQRYASAFTYTVNVGLIGVSTTGWVDQMPVAGSPKLRVGSSTPTALRVGSSVAQKVYLGATQVWP